MRKDDDGVYDVETDDAESDEESFRGGTRVNAAVPRDGKRINATRRRDDEEAEGHAHLRVNF